MLSKKAKITLSILGSLTLVGVGLSIAFLTTDVIVKKEINNKFVSLKGDGFYEVEKTKSGTFKVSVANNKYIYNKELEEQYVKKDIVSKEYYYSGKEENRPDGITSKNILDDYIDTRTKSDKSIYKVVLNKDGDISLKDVTDQYLLKSESVSKDYVSKNYTTKKLISDNFLLKSDSTLNTDVEKYYNLKSDSISKEFVNQNYNLKSNSIETETLNENYNLKTKVNNLYNLKSESTLKSIVDKKYTLKSTFNLYIPKSESILNTDVEKYYNLKTESILNTEVNQNYNLKSESKSKEFVNQNYNLKSESVLSTDVESKYIPRSEVESDYITRENLKDYNLKYESILSSEVKSKYILKSLSTSKAIVNSEYTSRVDVDRDYDLKSKYNIKSESILITEVNKDFLLKSDSILISELVKNYQSKQNVNKFYENKSILVDYTSNDDLSKNYVKNSIIDRDYNLNTESKSKEFVNQNYNLKSESVLNTIVNQDYNSKSNSVLIETLKPGQIFKSESKNGIVSLGEDISNLYFDTQLLKPNSVYRKEQKTINGEIKNKLIDVTDQYVNVSDLNFINDDYKQTNLFEVINVGGVKKLVNNVKYADFSWVLENSVYSVGKPSTSASGGYPNLRKKLKVDTGNGIKTLYPDTYFVKKTFLENNGLYVVSLSTIKSESEKTNDYSISKKTLVGQIDQTEEYFFTTIYKSHTNTGQDTKKYTSYSKYPDKFRKFRDYSSEDIITFSLKTNQQKIFYRTYFDYQNKKIIAEKIKIKLDNTGKKPTMEILETKNRDVEMEGDYVLITNFPNYNNRQDVINSPFCDIKTLPSGKKAFDLYCVTHFNTYDDSVFKLVVAPETPLTEQEKVELFKKTFIINVLVGRV